NEGGSIVEAATSGLRRIRRADHYVGFAVAIQVAGSGQCRTDSAVAAGDAKALRPEGSEVDRRSRRLAEDDVCGATTERPRRTHDGVRDAVAVDVASIRNH